VLCFKLSRKSIQFVSVRGTSLTTPSRSKLSPDSILSGSLPDSWSGVLVQTSALALAMMLGFGIGVTFQSDRDAKILAGTAAQQSARVAAQKIPEGAPETQIPSQIVAQPASPPALAAPASPPVERPAPVAPPAVAAKPPAPAEAAQQPGLVSYAYVYRYEKDGGFGYEFKLGKFDNVSAARVAAISECQQKGGRNCKFNFAPAGLCIAVARPPSGQYRVSEPLPDEAAASSAARELCQQDHASGCHIDKVLCP
jgi:hypothetical protein